MPTVPMVKCPYCDTEFPHNGNSGSFQICPGCGAKLMIKLSSLRREDESRGIRPRKDKS